MGKKEEKEEQRRKAGQAYLAELLALVPEDKRGSIKEVLESESEAVYDFLGNGVNRQSDYSRAMDKLREDQKVVESDASKARQVYEDNIRWKAAEQVKVQKVLEENARMRKQLADDLDDDDGGNGAGLPNGFDPSKFISKEDADKLMAEKLANVERDGLSVMSAMTKLGGRHIKEFGEVLDPDELIKVAQDNGVNLVQAYDIHVSEIREERRQKAHEEELEKVRKESREATLAEVRQQGSNLPYPIDNSEPSIIDQLKADKSQFGVKAAVDEFYKGQKSAAS